MIRIVYLHGCNSSPQSVKARKLEAYCRDHVVDAMLQIPALSHELAEAARQLRELLKSREKPVDLLVGSSLGGYYATFFAEARDATQ